MLRCALLAAAIVVSAALPAAAEVQPRTFPANALRGEIVVTAPPEILLNGRPARLAPGSRIHDQNHMLLLSGALVNRRFVAHYTRDHAGQPLEVWILTPAEAARRPWPVNDAQLTTWFFDAAAQKWTSR
jgi:hypothetical protein